MVLAWHIRENQSETVYSWSIQSTIQPICILATGGTSVIFYGNKTDHHTSYVEEKIIVFFYSCKLEQIVLK